MLYPRLRLLPLLLPALALASFNQSTQFQRDPVRFLQNGKALDSTIAVPGEVDVAYFFAEAGEGLEFRITNIGPEEFDPVITVYGPDGLGTDSTSYPSLDLLSMTAPLTGTYQVRIRDDYVSQVGTYRLSFARASGGSELPPLANGAGRTGTIRRGDIQVYRFNASSLQRARIRMARTGTGTLTPLFQVHKPDGSLVGGAGGHPDELVVAEREFGTHEPGWYTVIVTDSYSDGLGGFGNYELQLAIAPGANEHGPLPSEGFASGEITTGDIDSYTFEASLDETVQLRMAAIGNATLDPEISVYAPDGRPFESATSSDVAELSFDAEEPGTYTVLVADGKAGILDGRDDTGNYELHFKRALSIPEHGKLANGRVHTESITPGDLDSYTFDAEAGQGVKLRVASLGPATLTPEISVYYTTGGLFLHANARTVADLQVLTPITGTYTVVVADSPDDGYGGTGPYELRFVRAPAPAEHGTLISDGVKSEQITLGDMDTYTFEAVAGEGLELRMARTGSSSLTPEFWVFPPDGQYLSGGLGATVGATFMEAPQTGFYTVLVTDGVHDSLTGTGSYELRWINTTSANEHGLLAPGADQLEEITLGDMDSYTFEGVVGMQHQVDVEALPGGSLIPCLRIYDPSGSRTFWDSGSPLVSTGTFFVSSSGTYTVVVTTSVTGGYDGTGEYRIRFGRM
ncbi:MAG: hypothetical protein AAGG01_05025 [Planctomycetota bacterium]